MSNSRGYASCIRKNLAKNLARAAIRLQNKVKANKKNSSLNCLVEAGCSFEFYVEVKVKTKTRFLLNKLADFS